MTSTWLAGTSREGRLGGQLVSVDVVKPDTLPYHYTARLHWSVPDAFVGYGSGGNAACNVSELRQYVPYADTEQDVPLQTLAGTAPFTLTFTGGPLHWDKTNINQPVSLDYSWTFTLTLQRVDAAGAALG